MTSHVFYRYGLIASLAPALAFAQPSALRVVARTEARSEWSTRPVQARVGEDVTLAVMTLGPRGRLDPLPEGASVRWRRVVPRTGHRDHPSPNPGLTSFSNAVLFGPRHGRWIGYDRLEYDTTPVTAEGPTLSVRDAGADHGGAGSSWYAAEVALPDGRTLRTPDGNTVDALGLSPTVLRVSFRTGDDFLGWLSTYFHVTSVFGSNGGTDATHQTDRYTGADCADVMVGALRASGRRAVRYTSVAGIHEYAVARTRVLWVEPDGSLRGERGAVELRWSTDVLPGDLVTIDYVGAGDEALPRAWDHIGALVADRNGNGVLDGADTLRHEAATGLDDTPLRHAGAMRVVLWRWREGLR
ncbi:MAG: hypothetical protein IPF99_25490 [Deltaproteobacteria bacterium]|nr:hypothetical protein [Deltaproteobacteria bacterium]